MFSTSEKIQSYSKVLQMKLYVFLPLSRERWPMLRLPYFLIHVNILKYTLATCHNNDRNAIYVR